MRDAVFPLPVFQFPLCLDLRTLKLELFSQTRLSPATLPASERSVLEAVGLESVLRVSLAVFVVSVGLFVLSWFADGVIASYSKELPDPGTNPQWYGRFEYRAAFDRGEVGFSRIRLDCPFAGLPTTERTRLYTPAFTVLRPWDRYDTFYFSSAGFEGIHYVNKWPDTTVQSFDLTLPLWLFFFAAIPPWLRWRRRSRRHRRGFPVTPTPPATLNT